MFAGNDRRRHLDMVVSHDSNKAGHEIEAIIIADKIQLLGELFVVLFLVDDAGIEIRRVCVISDLGRGRAIGSQRADQQRVTEGEFNVLRAPGIARHAALGHV